MEFSLTDEQVAFKNSVFKFSQNEILPYMEEYEQRGEFCRPAWEKIAEFGLPALPFPEKYGGHEADVLTTCLAYEALTHGGADGGTCLTLEAHTVLCGIPIWKLGTDAQKDKYLPKITSGEWLGGFAITEPNAGSDASGVQTTAVKDGDKYILNGTKIFITNGPVGNVFVVIAVTNKEAGQFGISAFLVEKDFPGFSVGKKLDKMGYRTSATSELVFEDCEVPAENLLGQEGFGFITVGKSILEYERSCLLAELLGRYERTLDICVQYAKDRHQFGRPIASFQAIQRKLAMMRIWLDTCRLAIYRVATMKDKEQSAMLEACTAKLFNTEIGVRISEEAVQIHGGYGYMKEYEVERTYRDAKVGTIGAGTSEVQRSIISRMILDCKKGGR